MDKPLVTYAQNREDLILSGFFDAKERGFYVDVGAHDAEADSVTKYFYERGWHGINIEPLRQYYEKLKKERTRDINLNIGIGDKNGELVLREYINGTGLSTFSENAKADHEKETTDSSGDFVDHRVQIRTLAEVFKEFNVKHISFLKVDVEGYEHAVLAGNDWKKFRPLVICIEANHINKDWRPLLKENGYHLEFFDGLNNYYIDTKKTDQLKKFSYVDSVVFREPIVSYRLYPALIERDRLKERAAELEQELKIRDQSIQRLDRLVRELTPLRRHIKRQIKLRMQTFDRKAISRLSAGRAYKPAPVNSNVALADIHKIDSNNFSDYNQSCRIPLGLSVYLLLRRGTVHFISTILGLRRV